MAALHGNRKKKMFSVMQTGRLTGHVLFRYQKVRTIDPAKIVVSF